MSLPHWYQVGARADPDGLNDTWVGGYHLGMGGEGVVNLWAKVDKNGKIVRTLAIKDELGRYGTVEPEEYAGFYEDLVGKGLDKGASLIYAPGHARPDERFCKEAYVQGMLTSAKNEDRTDCVPLIGYKQRRLPENTGKYHTLDHWRLFMRYYACGDLNSLIKRHKEAKKPIPEPFIWWTLFCLIQACQQMENRVRERSKGTYADRLEVIVAFDIKPHNVLLAHPGGDSFPAYPRPMVADFGGAKITHVNDPANHNGTFMGAWTPGWRPPEVAIHKRKGRGIDDMKLSWSNIWQVGRMLECMMKLKTHIAEPDYWSHNHKERESTILDDKTPFKYSDGLRNIVWSCQRYRPYRRPTVDEVIRSITQNRAQWSEMEAWGLPEWVEKHKTDKKRKRDDEGGEDDSKATKKRKTEGGVVEGVVEGGVVEGGVVEAGGENGCDQGPDMTFASFFQSDAREVVWDLYNKGIYIPKNCDIIYRGDETDWQRGHGMYDENGVLQRPLGFRFRNGKAELDSAAYGEAYGTLEARKRRVERGSPKGSDDRIVEEAEKAERDAEQEEEDERIRVERAVFLQGQRVDQANEVKHLYGIAEEEAEDEEEEEEEEEEENQEEGDDDGVAHKETGIDWVPDEEEEEAEGDGPNEEEEAAEGEGANEDVIMGETSSAPEDADDKDYDNNKDGISFDTQGDVKM